MEKVIFGNHAAVMVRHQERDAIRKFYGDVLGCKTAKEFTELASQGGMPKDIFHLADNFVIVFLYGDFDDQNEFLRSGRAMYLELKSDNVDATRKKIIDFGAKVIEIPDPHFYFQAPGGQVFKLVGIDEDLSVYEGST